MHVFAVLFFFGLGVMALTMLGSRYASRREVRALTAILIGIALAWLADFNIWTAWGIHLRYAWVGVTLTGVALAGTALLVHAILGFFAGLHRKFDDQAEALERQELRRVA